MRTKERIYPGQGSARKVTREDVPGAEAWVYETHSTLYAYGWKSEKQVNHDFHHRFHDNARRDLFLKAWFDSHQRVAKTKQDRKDAERLKREQPNPFKVGDILVYSWGYDQTNVDFYQVVEVKPRSVVIREIACEVVNDDAQGVGTGHSMADYRVARRDKFISEELLTKVVQWAGEKPCVAMDHSYAVPWNGDPKYCSWYA